MRAVEEELINVAAKVENAEQTIEPIRQNLARTGQALSADISSATIRMRGQLEKAKRDARAGNFAGARESLSIADALANKVLKSVGR